jgi:hypothetical protein
MIKHLIGFVLLSSPLFLIAQGSGSFSEFIDNKFIIKEARYKINRHYDFSRNNFGIHDCIRIDRMNYDTDSFEHGLVFCSIIKSYKVLYEIENLSEQKDYRLNGVVLFLKKDKIIAFKMYYYGVCKKSIIMTEKRNDLNVIENEMKTLSIYTR